MKTKFIVIIEKDEDGLFLAKVPDLPGCNDWGYSSRWFFWVGEECPPTSI
ncbi:MAG: type II toxin-antitoxin system HicB family antitoxin [Elusimicrobiota bacterium]